MFLVNGQRWRQGSGTNTLQNDLTKKVNPFRDIFIATHPAKAETNTTQWLVTRVNDIFAFSVATTEKSSTAFFVLLKCFAGT